MGNKYRVLILEDEYINLDILRDYLEVAGYEISGDAMKADEAIEILERFDTDIAILDINVKGDKDGIWVAEQIRKHYHIPFIFLTAYSDPTTVKRAATINPYGYLVKPFTEADIYTAIEIAMANYDKEDKTSELSKEMMVEDKELGIDDFIFIKEDFMYKKIRVSDIHYIQSFKNYLTVCLSDSKIQFRTTLKKILEILPKKYFAQIHRSFVVNINYIEGINADYVMTPQKKIPMSKTYREDFVKKLPFLT